MGTSTGTVFNSILKIHEEIMKDLGFKKLEVKK